MTGTDYFFKKLAFIIKNCYTVFRNAVSERLPERKLYMSLDNMKFHRVFSKSMYKNLKLPLGEMSFTKDFVNDSRGDLYPLTEKSEMCTEQAEGNRYIVSGGTAERMFTRFLPFATYEISFESENGGGGFVFPMTTVPPAQ